MTYLQAMSTPISTIIQQSNVDAVINLFQLDATPVGGSVLYFTDQAVDGAAPIFGGVEFAPVRVEFDGMEVSGQGTLPSPTVQVYNDANNTIRSVANNIGALEGCIVKRIRVFERHLDGRSEADPSRYIGPDIFQIDRKVEDTSEHIKWQLTAMLDQDGRQIPKRRALRDVCMFRYRYWTGSDFDYSNAQCQYTGDVYYDRQDNVVTDPSQDRCSRHLAACKLRFGANNPLPFGGFPGINRVSQ